jgi:hypothetical protein
VPTHEPRGRREERDDTLLAALAGGTHQRRPVETEVDRAKVQEFLDPHAGVIQERQDKVVATPLGRASIWAVQNGPQLRNRQIAQVAPDAALERNGEDLLRQGDRRWLLARHVGEEGTERSQPCVSSGDAIVASLLEVLEETQDRGWCQVLQSELGDVSSRRLR